MKTAHIQKNVSGAAKADFQQKYGNTPRPKTQEQMTTAQKIFGVLAFLSFFYALGVVGGIETDSIPLGAGAIRAFFAIGCFGLFTHLAGADSYEDEAHDKH